MMRPMGMAAGFLMMVLVAWSPAQADGLGQLLAQLGGGDDMPPAVNGAVATLDEEAAIGGRTARIRIDRTEEPALEVITRYVAEASARGWQAQVDQRQGAGRSVILHKGRSWVALTGQSAGQGELLFWTSWTDPADWVGVQDGRRALLDDTQPRDVLGRDLPSIPRYPGSLRRNAVHVDKSGVTMLAYETPDALQTVAAFYRRQLPLQGWRVVKDEPYVMGAEALPQLQLPELPATLQQQLTPETLQQIRQQMDARVSSVEGVLLEGMGKEGHCVVSIGRAAVDEPAGDQPPMTLPTIITINHDAMKHGRVPVIDGRRVW